MWLFERKAFDLCPMVCNLKRIGHVNEVANVTDIMLIFGWGDDQACMNT